MAQRINWEWARKIIECSCHRGDFSAEICAGRKQRQRNWHRPRTREAYTTIVVDTDREEGRTYAEIAKKIRSGIKGEDTGVEIMNMAKARNGRLMLTVRETEKGGREKLQKEINEKTNLSSEIREKRIAKKTVIIKDIDESTSEEELKEALHSVTSGDSDIQKISPIRRNKDGTGIAFVDMRASAAAMALKNKRIKIGWTRCRILERVEPEWCRNCQKYGHRAQQCTSDKIVGVRCLKCSKIGHVAKECQNPKHCANCDIEGHKGNTFECPKYKEMIKNISEKKLEERKKRTKNRIDAGKENENNTAEASVEDASNMQYQK